MTILELIKAQCKVQGISEKYAERIEKASGITEEKDGNVIAAVKNFKENILPIIDEEKKAAVEDDKKKNQKSVEKSADEPGKVELPKDLDPSIKALIENQNKMIESLTKSVTSIVDTQKKSSTLETVKAKLKGKVDEKFIEKIAAKVNLDAEDLDKEVEGQIAEFNDFKQSLINEYVGDRYVQTEGGTAGDKSVEDWAKLMDGNTTVDTGVVDLGLGK